MRDDEELTAIIICAPEDWEHTQDSILIDADCGHKVWVATAGQRVLEEHGDTGVARCVPCVMPQFQEKYPGVIPEAAPGVLADIERDKGGWERQKYEAFAKHIGLTTNG